MAEKETRSLSRFDPFADFDWMPVFAPFGRGWAREVFGGRGVAPAVNVTENDAAYVVTAELPGCKREDVSVEIDDRTLTLRGEKRDEREEKKEKRHYVERSYGSFTRSFTLPADAKADDVKATFSEGVLTITIAKAPTSKPRVVDIKS
jgi:HSP20 family protein